MRRVKKNCWISDLEKEDTIFWCLSEWNGRKRNLNALADNRIACRGSVFVLYLRTGVFFCVFFLGKGRHRSG